MPRQAWAMPLMSNVERPRIPPTTGCSWPIVPIRANEASVSKQPEADMDTA